MFVWKSCTDIYAVLRRYSKVYVNKITSALPPSHLHLNTPIKSVSTTTLSSALSSFSTVTQVQLETATGEISTFDHVILACHADENVRILTAGSGGNDEEREREKDVLGMFGWNRNEVVLHSDVRVRRYIFICLLSFLDVCYFQFVVDAEGPYDMVVLELFDRLE